jgi:hypothetical protein
MKSYKGKTKKEYNDAISFESEDGFLAEHNETPKHFNLLYVFASSLQLQASSFKPMQYYPLITKIHQAQPKSIEFGYS